MKTTSFQNSEETHKTYLSRSIFNQKEFNTLDSLSVNNPKNYIQELINSIPEFKQIAEGLFWSDERVPREKLIEAWTHKSFLNELGDAFFPSYERWEFLGDSVFGNYITERLFNKFEHKNEGHLSKLKSQLVSGDTMAELATAIDLDRLIILGKGEVNRESFRNRALLSDIFEATIGVISHFLPRQDVLNFLDRVVCHHESVKGTSFYNVESLLKKEVKGELQEITMKRFKILPDYQSKETSKGYEVNLFIDGKLYGHQFHQSKKMAQKLCAQEAIKQLTLNN